MSSVSAFWMVSVVCSLGLVACGDDDGSNGGGDLGGGGQGGDQKGGGNDQGGADSGGGGGGVLYPPVECGDALTCDAGDVCIVEPNAAECMALGEGESCPEGTTETNCGGAGLPCCCGPTPPPDYSCTSGAACGGALPTCECLDPCTGDDECAPLGVSEYAFQCEPPAMP